MRASRCWRAMLLASALALLAVSSAAIETETLLLSGTGFDDAVEWEFFCNEGRGCDRWTTIPVPSMWELQGFGTYNYGHDKAKSDEEGRYRYRFTVPLWWRDRTVDLVFDGVMTDAEVRLNGESAGPVHQGAFYRFRYEVTALLDFYGENVLEVDVRKKSSNLSVNRAERDADYWIFGGIFRPVFLQAVPSESIDHVAIDARHDGSFRLRARTRGVTTSRRLEARILDAGGEEATGPFGTAFTGQEAVDLETRIPDPRPWSAETPDLYRVRLDLLGPDGELLHRRSERFGFRTIEIRRQQGLFVNGHRVLLKGVNRHSFWPDSGRTLTGELNRRDAELIKAMNLNAVRMSHYPPDESFLDACDELGLYVLDEIAGWHDAYDTAVGRRLVRETVERDLNHPSILFWDNGNEGGWNSALDREFAEYDLQARPVLRPDALASGIQTKHYLTWKELGDLLADWPGYKRWIFGDPPLVMPTELLHGLYDGGSGASLGEYWEALRRSPRGAGAFLWAFTDEAVIRSDKEKRLDSAGNYAPDGVIGPYRELSGNSYAVREIFSPVVVLSEVLDESFNGGVEMENRYDMVDLSTVTFRWSWVTLPRPGDPDPALAVLESGETAGPQVGPDERGELRIPLPPDDAQALRLEAFDTAGCEILSWVLPRWGQRRLVSGLIDEGEGTVTAREDGGRLRLRAGDAEAVFDLDSGRLLSLGTQRLDGPRALHDMDAPVESVRHRGEGFSYVVEVRYEDGFDVRWRFHPSGWLRLAYQLRIDGRHDYFGIGFPVPADQVSSLEWLGHGPARIWKNRREGGVLGVWRKDREDDPGSEWAHEPKLAGYYGGVVWANVTTAAGELTVVLGDDLDLGVASPRFPNEARDAVAAVPSLGLSILNGISAIGTKFYPANELGPQGRPHEPDGLYQGTVWFYAGMPPSAGTE